MSHVYTNETAGFVTTKVIYNKEHDVEGFVGYLTSD
jgi:hypothetical protein